MKVLLDLNVILDVVQDRIPHYRDSAEIISRARHGTIEAVIPAHAITTLHYILTKAMGRAKADQTADWLLVYFQVAPASKDTFRRARELVVPDFEDTVVASLAEAARCDYIITRNEPDFLGSPVPVLSPTAFLAIPAAKYI